MEAGASDSSLLRYRTAAASLLRPAGALGEVDDDQLDGLLVQSQAVERDAGLDLDSGDADVRELAALQLEAGAALDLAVAAELLERAEPGAGLDAPPLRVADVSR